MIELSVFALTFLMARCLEQRLRLSRLLRSVKQLERRLEQLERATPARARPVLRRGHLRLLAGGR